MNIRQDMRRLTELRMLVLLTMEQERTWVQCLHEKDDQWVPEPDDEDFEIAAKHCFVTGISKHGVRSPDVYKLRPVRHGIEDCRINNDQGAWELPMHPACFEM
jgi:hypothetical protein